MSGEVTNSDFNIRTSFIPAVLQRTVCQGAGVGAGETEGGLHLEGRQWRCLQVGTQGPQVHGADPHHARGGGKTPRRAVEGKTQVVEQDKELDTDYIQKKHGVLNISRRYQKRWAVVIGGNAQTRRVSPRSRSGSCSKALCLFS